MLLILEEMRIDSLLSVGSDDLENSILNYTCQEHDSFICPIYCELLSQKGSKYFLRDTYLGHVVDQARVQSIQCCSFCVS